MNEENLMQHAQQLEPSSPIHCGSSRALRSEAQQPRIRDEENIHQRRSCIAGPGLSRLRRGAASAKKAEQSHNQTAEASFMAENQAAMSKMMKDMAVKPSGNIDADFTAMMIPHHQGAVDMAQAELRYGHNRKLRRIARNIIAGQRQQIAAMKVALGQPHSAATSSSTQSGRASDPGPATVDSQGN
jgi:Domain of unknown function (DUF305)